MPSLLAQFSGDDGFLDEIASALPVLEANLNRLEQKPDDAQALEQAYRRAWRISETASMQDAMGLSQVAHAMQDVLGDALDEVLILDEEALGLLRRSLERVRLIVLLLKIGTSDDERIVAEDTADHAAFRQQWASRPLFSYPIATHWQSGNVVEPEASEAEIREWVEREWLEQER